MDYVLFLRFFVIFNKKLALCRSIGVPGIFIAIIKRHPKILALGGMFFSDGDI